MARNSGADGSMTGGSGGLIDWPREAICHPDNPCYADCEEVRLRKLREIEEGKADGIEEQRR